MVNQAILIELQQFITGKINFHRNEAPEVTKVLIKRSLLLLEELPIYRDLIFEYFSTVFDASIGKSIQTEKNLIAFRSYDDEALSLVTEGLEKLLLEQSLWATYISKWSLSRLLKPSLEYANLLNMDFRTACKLWLESKAIRSLLDLSGLCFSKFDDVEAKRYIFDLENIFAENRPKFDWAVAHLSSMFPVKFISNILRMPSMLSPAFISSTVTVLEYLARTIVNDLQSIINEMLSEALAGPHPNLKTKDYIPNLMQLASKSVTYAQVMINVFMDRYSEQFIEQLKEQFLLWPLDYNPVMLQILIPDVLLQSRENGARLIIMFAKSFDNSEWMREIIEIILTEMENRMFDTKSCPLFNDIYKEHSWQMLWDAAVSDKLFIQQTSIRMILCVSDTIHPLLYYKTVEDLITRSPAMYPNAFNALVRIIGGPLGTVDAANPSIAISHLIERLSIDITSHVNGNQCQYILKNLVDLTTTEKANLSPFLKRGTVMTPLQDNLKSLITIWEKMLNKAMITNDETLNSNENTDDNDDDILKKIRLEIENEDPMEIAELETEKVYYRSDHIHMLSKLIENIDIPESISISDALKLEKSTVKYFFWVLRDVRDAIQRSESAERCYGLLSRQCLSRKAIRSASLRDLLEGALFQYGEVFCNVKKNQMKKSERSRDDMLLVLNQKQGISLNSTRSSILHSGQIGTGLGKGQGNIQNQWLDDGLNSERRNLYLKALVACCHDDKDSKATIDGFKHISLLLVEMISIDVMYNGLPWPPEDFSRVTIERDLHIRRTFKNCPILWSILGLLAVYKPSLCYCSVFLRAICATVLHHWRADSIKSSTDDNNELMFFTTKLLELLALGQLLPPPLSYLYIVVEHLEANEIVYVLKECVWNYMVANVPAPALFGFDANNQRVFMADQPRVPEEFQDPLRNTMQKRLSTMGHLYYQMFVLPKQLNFSMDV